MDIKYRFGWGWVECAFPLNKDQAEFWGAEVGTWMVVRSTSLPGGGEGSWSITWRIFT